MKKYIRITSIIITLLTLAGSAVFSMTSCSGEKSNESSEKETTEMSIEETTEELTAEISYDVTEYIDPEPYYEPEIIDYSDFGFENTYGMDNWIKIKGYSFSADDSYVYTTGDYATVHFNRNFLKQLRWDRSDCDYNLYDETIGTSGGYVFNTVNYGIVDNDTISFVSGYYNGSTFYIENREMVNGIPILECKFNSTSRHDVYDSGWYIPSGFINWSLSPERGKHTTDEGQTIDVVKYYIDESFIN